MTISTRRSLIKIISFFTLLFLSPFLFGQISLFKDINTSATKGSSHPSNFAKIGNLTVFVAETETTGKELWVTDGTTNGTHFLKDLFANGGSDPAHLFEYNGFVYFTVLTDNYLAYELWKTDGTVTGTQSVNYSPAGWPSGEFLIFNGVLYFISSGNELWKTDGTSMGPTLVKEVYTGYQNAYINNLTVFNGNIYFVAWDGTGNSHNLWKSDGTNVGTNELTGVTVTGGTASLSNLVVVGSTLFFNSGNLTTGQELWKTDGTIAGSQLVKDINTTSVGASSQPTLLTAYNGELYFIADDGINGFEVWKSDGTTAGTVLLKNINPLSGQSSTPSNFYVFNGSLYFSANDGTNGFELWKTDGTTAGTNLFVNIYAAASNSNPSNFLVSNNQLFFTANSASYGIELWKTNGTVSGTVMVKDIFPGWGNGTPGNLFDFNGTLLFEAQNALNNFELWSSDGTTSGTFEIKNIYTDISSSSVKHLTEFNNKTFFVANDGTVNEGMWATNGTTPGTSLVTSMGSSSSGGFPPEAAKLNNELIYNAGPISLREIYKTNGTPSGSQLLTVIQSTYGSNPANFTKCGNYIFFTAYTFSTGRELWRTDGTVSGTVLVKNIGLGSNDGNIKNLIDVNGTLYFSATFGTQQLWKSDGTTAGTVAVTNYNSNSSEFNNFFIFNGQLHFEYSNYTTNNSLRKTDGTASGTINIKTLPTSANGGAISVIENVTLLDSLVYFSTVLPMGGFTLWRSDGTTAGTYGISVNNAGYPSISINQIVACQGFLYFDSFDYLSGREIWKSDGTSSGTYLLKDINPGVASSYPQNLKAYNGTLFFSASNGVNGHEFWKTNGALNNTLMFAQLDQDETGSDPKFLTSFGNKMIFSAYSKNTGRELFSYINTQNLSVTTCNSYFWPQTGQTYNSSGFYTDTLINSQGLDSIFTLSLTVNSNTSIDSVTTCDSLVWIDGNTYYASNNTATHILLNSFGCDSTITLNLTIHNSISIFDVQIACDSFLWMDGNTYYASNSTATHVLTNSFGCDSTIILDLTIIPSIQAIASTFSLPSDVNYCLGAFTVTLTGNPDYNLSINTNSNVSSGYSLFDSICPGVHNLNIIDGCGDTSSQLIVVPSDSNFVFNNPFIDSIAVDSLGVTLGNCTIYYNSIDTAYINSIVATGNSVFVIWNIVDSTGSNFDTVTYVLTNGPGVYWLQLNIFCSTKSNGAGFFTVTQAIYFDNGIVITADNDELQRYNIAIFPNPTRNYLQIQLPFSANGKFGIMDVTGKLVDEFYSNETMVKKDISELNPGVYFIRIELNFQTIVKKFIIE